MIFTYEDYIRAIDAKLRLDPTEVWIATFSIQAGISSRGQVFRSSIGNLVTRVSTNTENSRMLVGVNPDDRIGMRKVEAAAYQWRSIAFRTRPDSHLKCWIFFYGKGNPCALIGGRNLSDSRWHDLSLWAPRQKDVKELIRQYDKIWKSADPVRLTEPVKLRRSGRVV